MHLPHPGLAALFLSLLSRVSETVRCLCSDASSCKTNVCVDSWCLVGVSASDSRVVRRCRNNTALPLNRCWADAENLDEACVCQTNFCNTYRFFRNRVRRNGFYPFFPAIQSKNSLGPYRKGPRNVNMRLSSPLSNSPHIPRHSQPSPPNPFRIPKKRDKSLILVLVIVPLGVGALACFILVLFSYGDACGPRYNPKRPLAV